MRKFRLMLLSLAALTLFGACDDAETPVAGDLPAGYVWASANDAIVDGAVKAPMLFLGRAEVETIATGERYVDEKARFEVAPTVAASPDEARTVALYMHETRFAAQMPPLEMEAHGIGYTAATNGVALAAARIVPQIAGTPYERYTLTEIDGKTEGIDFSLTFVCAGIYRVRYVGRLIVKQGN